MKNFNKEEQNVILELARVSMMDADIYTLMAEKLDLSDEFMKALQEKMYLVMESPVFEFSCSWVKGKRLIILDSINNHPCHNIATYGKDIYKEMQEVKKGGVVKWEEPFNGWAKAKRVK